MENMVAILTKAKNGGYAVPHFNINNLEWTRFILEEAQRLQSPIILGVSVGASKYMGGLKTVAAMVKALVKDLKITVPVVLHLDHGDFLSAMEAINAGFTSVMYDGSKESLAENIKKTKEIVNYARQKGVSVEAEVGAIGGSEDGVADELKYAKVEDALELALKTGIDALAPALGSVHGLYKGTPNLDFKRMKEISNKTNLPLVLHGGTGIYDEQIKEAIKCGICKINVNTELQIAWSKGVREFLVQDQNEYDPRKIIKAGEATMKKAIASKIELFGSAFKA